MASYLQWPDYLILAIFLVMSLAIGIYHSLTGGKQKTTSEFIMADRQLKVIPTAISLLVSFQSAISLLGLTAEMYCYGIQYLIYIVASMIIGVVIVERTIIPWLYPLKLVSIYEYLERRFKSKSIQIYGSSLGITAGILIMGIAMYAPSAALESATGLPLSVSIPIMAVVCVAYTALGGMRAVIWTDVFQFLIMISGILAILIKGLIVVGGFSNIFRLAQQEGRLVLANISPDPRERHTVWGILVGISVSFCHAYGLSQTSIQRYSAVTSQTKAKLTLMLNIPPLIVMNCMYSLMGLIVLAYYATIKCDPLVNKDIHNANQLLPYFVVTIFADSPGFGGLFLATLYGASLSSISSALSGSAANVWEDILKWKLNKLSDSRQALINRFLVLLLGVLSTGIAFLVAAVPGPIIQVTMAMLGSVNGPLLGLFLLGGITRKANWKGSLLGGLVGLAFNFWLSIGSMTVPHIYRPLPPVSTEGCYVGNSTFNFSYPEFNSSVHALEEIDFVHFNKTHNTFPRKTELRGFENFYAISYVWFVTFGTIVTTLVGFVASLILKDHDLDEKIDERLLLRFRNCRCSCKTDSTDPPEDNVLTLDSKVSNDYKILKNDNNNFKKLDDDSFKETEEEEDSLIWKERETTV